MRQVRRTSWPSRRPTWSSRTAGDTTTSSTAWSRVSHARATVLNVVELSGKKAAAGGELNEHVWYDFPTVTRLADKIATALTRPSTARTRLFSRQTQRRSRPGPRSRERGGEPESLSRRRGSRHHRAGAALPAPGSGSAQRDPSGVQRCRRGGQRLSPLVLKQTLDLFTSGRVKALVYNEQTSGPITEK